LKVGVALGGGGARGYAHFGVLFALEKCGIQVDCVAGASIGAAVGALWATHQHLDCYRELRKLSKSGVREYLDPEIPILTGILKGGRLYRLLESWFKGYRIEHLTRQFCANAVELNTGTEVTFTEGNLADAIRASISLPVILSPWKMGGINYLDGGVVNPLPVKQCFEMGADMVIAVDLLGTFSGRDTGKPSLFHLPEDLSELAGDIPGLKRLLSPVVPEIALAAILISQKALTDSNLQRWKPTFLIQPDLSGYTGGEFHMLEEISAKGFDAAEETAPEILKKLNS